MIGFLKSQGLTDATIGIVVIIAVSFLAIVGLAVVGLIAYFIARGIEVPPFLGVALGSLLTFAITLITGHATTTQINGSATQVATAVATAVTSKSQALNTVALESNTQAVKEQTDAMANNAGDRENVSNSLCTHQCTPSVCKRSGHRNSRGKRINTNWYYSGAPTL